jgi:heme-degrading monooxygenase HmoA
MPWGFVTELPISLEDYDRLNGEIGQDPEGLILHHASQSGNGVRICDVWESKDAYERFERDTLMPAAERAGLQMGGERPPRDEYEVHNMRGPAAQGYR